jgi:glutamate dehydrogenase
MIAYTKNADVEEMLVSDLPDEPALERRPARVLPVELRERYPESIRAHRLRREIVATGSSTTWSTSRGSRSITG